jgi:hypothetical protein
MTNNQTSISAVDALMEPRPLPINNGKNNNNDIDNFFSSSSTSHQNTSHHTSSLHVSNDNTNNTYNNQQPTTPFNEVFISTNARGLNNPNKKSDFFKEMQSQKGTVFFIQETKISQKLAAFYKKSWSGGINLVLCSFFKTRCCHPIFKKIQVCFQP